MLPTLAEAVVLFLLLHVIVICACVIGVLAVTP
jgi:hypothetical protein